VRGSTIKRGRSWTAIYYETDENGRRKQRWRGGFRTQKDARSFLTGVLSAIEKGEYVTPSKTLLIDYLNDEWLPAVRPDLRPLSYNAYAGAVRTHVAARPWLARLPLQGVGPGHIRRLFTEMASAGKSRATRDFVRAVLSKAFSTAVEDNKLFRNPVSRVKLPKKQGGDRAKPTNIWTAGELRRFLEQVADERLIAAYRLAAMTGLRRGELLGLTWRSLDLDGARLTVEQALSNTRGGPSFAPPKTESARRTVTLDEETVESLQAHWERQKVERAVMGDVYEDFDLVFCHEDGRPINPQVLSDQFGTLVKSSGLPRIRFHDLRHSHASLMLGSGVSIKVVSARLGHSTPAMTLNVYSHLLPNSDAEAAKRVAGLVAAHSEVAD